MVMGQGEKPFRDDKGLPTPIDGRGDSAPADADKPKPKRRYKPRARKCGRCGKRFTPTRKGMKWCSATCRRAVSKQARRKADKRAKRDNPPKWSLLPRACERCGRAFNPTMPHKRFCSPKCQKRAAKARQRRRLDVLDTLLIEAERLGVLEAARNVPESSLASWLADVRACIAGAERLAIPAGIVSRYIVERGLQAAVLFIIGAASVGGAGQGGAGLTQDE